MLMPSKGLAGLSKLFHANSGKRGFKLAAARADMFPWRGANMASNNTCPAGGSPSPPSVARPSSSLSSAVSRANSLRLACLRV